MKRYLSCLLCLLLLGGLCACGGTQTTGASPAAQPTVAPEQAPAATVAPAAAGIPASYAEAYALYWSVYGAVLDEVGRRLDANNAALETIDPQGYYMDPTYLALVYVPFSSTGPAVGNALSEGSLDAAEELIRFYWPDAELTRVAEGSYRADYTYTNTLTQDGVVHRGACTWEFDAGTGAFRVVGYADGATADFTEFIPQGDGRYLLYTTADKALVTFVDGQVTELCHAHMINEAPMGAFAGDVRLNSLQTIDFYPNGLAEEGWLTEDENAQYVITIRDDEMRYAGRIAQDILSADGSSRTGVTWTESEPFQLRK